MEIRRDKTGLSLILADGETIAASAILSTLDLKRTFLGLFPWKALPRDLAARAGGYRMGGGTARLLLALDAPPDLPPYAQRSPLHLMPDAEALAAANSACRAGLIPDTPPAIARLISATDPALAPAGKAVLTLTLGAIAHRLFDGGWTRDKRDRLKARGLQILETALPGLSARVLAARLFVPPDMEAALGATGGDVWGGEIAADQMLGDRPGHGAVAPRTPLPGLYLAGGSTAAGLGASLASGAHAARAIIADKRAGRVT
jgi:phytoene dehydrogenase-like protein